MGVSTERGVIFFCWVDVWLNAELLCADVRKGVDDLDSCA